LGLRGLALSGDLIVRYALVDFFAVDGYVFGGVDAYSHLIAFDT
jgi:hypothetical protein